MSEWQTELDSMKAADEEDRFTELNEALAEEASALNASDDRIRRHLPGYASGGEIRGPGSSTNDSIPIMIDNSYRIPVMRDGFTIAGCPDCGKPPTLVMGSVHHCGTCDRVLISNPDGSMRRPTPIEARRIYELPVIRSLLGLKPASTTIE